MLPTSTPSDPSLLAPPNPMLTAYEAWVQKTPLVTRYILTVQVLSYLVSWFVNPHFALATIPQFVIFRFEWYRLFTSLLVNTNILSCIFAFLSFSDHGCRLEYGLGSTTFGWQCLCLGLVSNLLFLAICVILRLLAGESGQGFLLLSSAGLWTILFGVIAEECVQAPRTLQRTFFFFTVPALYYPLVLYAFFTLLSGVFSLSYLISICVGYAYGFGYLDNLKLSPDKAKQWEETVLVNFVRREGWVAGHAATGGDSWQDQTGGLAVLMFGAPRRAPADGGMASTSSGAGLVYREGTASSSAASSSSQPSFPTSSGRTLGSSSSSVTTRRSAAETRAARLQALERKAQENRDVE